MNVRQNDATPDGRVIAVVPGNPAQAAVSGVDADAPQFRVVLNWLEELKARVRSK